MTSRVDQVSIPQVVYEHEDGGPDPTISKLNERVQSIFKETLCVPPDSGFDCSSFDALDRQNCITHARTVCSILTKVNIPSPKTVGNFEEAVAILRTTWSMIWNIFKLLPGDKPILRFQDVAASITSNSTSLSSFLQIVLTSGVQHQFREAMTLPWQNLFQKS